MEALQKASQISSSLTQISSDLDLLKTKSIARQLKEHSRHSILTEVSLSVHKCIMGLNITMSNSAIALLCNDIIDKYKHDSIEDIQQCRSPPSLRTQT